MLRDRSVEFTEEEAFAMTRTSSREALEHESDRPQERACHSSLDAALRRRQGLFDHLGTI